MARAEKRLEIDTVTALRAAGPDHGIAAPRTASCPEACTPTAPCHEQHQPGGTCGDHGMNAQPLRSALPTLRPLRRAPNGLWLHVSQ